MSRAYASTADLVAAVPEVSSLSTAALLRLLTGAADDIDRYCSIDGLRTFRTYTATLDFSPDCEILDLPDLLTVTSVAQDLDADQTYSTTWATTDYRLWPLNAPTRNEPYTQLRTLPLGNYTLGWPNGWTGGFPREYLAVFSGPIDGAPSMRIAAKWGYRETLEDTTATLNGAISSTSATTFTASNGALLGIGQTILIDSEQMFISGIATNTITVERGVNGTTAATHLTAAAISRYTYPSAVADATFGYIRALRGGSMAAVASGVSRRRAGDLEIEYATRATGATGAPIFDFGPWLAGYRR